MALQIDVIVTLPGLDKKYELQCTCGFYRDYGYMWQTAEREFELHRMRHPDHEMDMIVRDAPKLSDITIKHRLYDGKKNRRQINTLRVEPGLW